MAEIIPPKALLDRRMPFLRLTWRDLPLWLIGMVVVAIWAAPFVWMVSTSLKPVSEVMTKEIEWLPRTVVWDNYIKVLEYPVVRWAINSVIVSVTATALCVVFGALAGYALARLRFPRPRLPSS